MDIKTIISKCGGPSAIAQELEISSQAVSQWRRVPANRVAKVSQLSGVPCSVIRPDVFLPRNMAGAAAPSGETAA